MSVIFLDHVNIRSCLMAESIAFYRDVLGMTVKPAPMTDNMLQGSWIYDAADRAVVHLIAAEQVIEGPEPISGAAQRGMVDHFALRCDDLPTLIANIRQAGLKYSELEVPQIERHFVFLRDPNGVQIELNFPL